MSIGTAPGTTIEHPGGEAAGRAAAFFDVDRTLIAGASALRMASSFRRGGLVTRRQQLRAGLAQLMFSLRGADDEGIERFSSAAKTLVAGWDRDRLRVVIADELERRLHPTVYREALERIDMHHRKGEPVYAVSATMDDIVQPLAELLGLDGAIGTIMAEEGGRLTGDIAEPCFGPHKLQRMRSVAEADGIDLSRSAAYSDSISDEPLLRAVGRAYAVNPDKELRRLAEQEGWGILFFRTRVKAPLHHHRGARMALAATLAAAAFRRYHRRARR